MFETIVSRKNLEAAYLELVGKFVEAGKESRYHGVDNHTILDYDLDSAELLSCVRDELIHVKAIEPALLMEIPKKYDPSKRRDIFIYTLKERVKAQAIYRVVLPVFEKHFSDRLFSYRPVKPSHIAAYLFARRYRRHFQSDHCLVVDLHNYSNLIDQKLLLQMLEGLFTDTRVLEILKLFVVNQIYDRGRIHVRGKGIVQGVPLIALFANLYLTDIDFKYTKQTAFYIRVGDDLALVDPSLEKLNTIAHELGQDLQARGLTLNQDKFFLGPASVEFSFLGYRFVNGSIGLQESFVTKLVLGWKRLLLHKNKTSYQKKMLLKKIMGRTNNFNTTFQEIVTSKPQLNNSHQIIALSETFFSILTEFYYGQYSERNRRLLGSVIADLNISSLYDQYKNFHYGRGRTSKK